MGLGGGTSVGFSYGGDLLNSRLFIKFQSNAMWGPGNFAGVGVSGDLGSGAVPSGINTTGGYHTEVNRGGGVSWSAGYDQPMDGSGGSASGFHERLPFGRLGVGYGWSVGSGWFNSSTVGLPSAADAMNMLIDSTNSFLHTNRIPFHLRQIQSPCE
jgi:hypothetical protein